MVFGWFKKKGDRRPEQPIAPPAETAPPAVVNRLPAPSADPVPAADVVHTRPVVAASADTPAPAPAKPAAAATKPTTAVFAARIPADEVSRRAFEIWVAKGRPDGTSEQDWLQAEAELAAERATAAGPA